MNKYKVDKLGFKELYGKVKLPSYQRRLVWSKHQREVFVKTLHNGYPFGSILVYCYEEDKDTKQFTLIDGLQRYTTMLDYSENPWNYINFAEYSNEICDTIYNNNIPTSTKSKAKSVVESSIRETLKKEASGINDPYFLLDELSEKSPLEVDKKNERYIVEFQAKIIKYANEYLDINKLEIPTIEFFGGESELATVFENLNLGGRKLSKYQVFAAQWSRHKFSLPEDSYNEKILQSIVDRYNKLDDERMGIEIIDFNEKDMLSTREVNLSEYCYGLGTLIIETSDCFWKQNEDKANEIGYASLAISLGVSQKTLEKTIDYIELFKDKNFLKKLTFNILHEYEAISHYFKQYLKYPNRKLKYDQINIANFHGLSYFATLWSIKYSNVQEDFNKNARYKNDYSNARNNFLQYLIIDIVENNWGNAGDAKLDKIYLEKEYKYLNSISKNKMEQVLLDWWDDIKIKPSINVDPLSRMLLVIYSNISDGFKLNHDEYDIEHIICRQLLKEQYKDKKIPGGTLGNLMFLDTSQNRGKKDQDLYMTLKEGQKLDENFVTANFYPSKVQMEDIRNEFHNRESNFSITKATIENRGKELLNYILNHLYVD